MENAINMIKTTISPHFQQVIQGLDTSTAEKRHRMSSQDILIPLEILFDFGELHCSEEPDPGLKPILLIGDNTKYLGMNRFQLLNIHGGNGEGNKSSKNDGNWLDQQSIGSTSIHGIVEGCEPSTGQFWIDSTVLCLLVYMDIRHCYGPC